MADRVQYDGTSESSAAVVQLIGADVDPEVDEDRVFDWNMEALHGDDGYLALIGPDGVRQEAKVGDWIVAQGDGFVVEAG